MSDSTPIYLLGTKTINTDVLTCDWLYFLFKTDDFAKLQRKQMYKSAMQVQF